MRLGAGAGPGAEVTRRRRRDRRGWGSARCAGARPPCGLGTVPRPSPGARVPGLEGALAARRPAQQMVGTPGGAASGLGGGPPGPTALQRRGIGSLRTLPRPPGSCDSCEGAKVPNGAPQPLSHPVLVSRRARPDRPLQRKGLWPRLSLSGPPRPGRSSLKASLTAQSLAFQGTFPSCITPWPLDRCLAIMLELHGILKNFVYLLCADPFTPRKQCPSNAVQNTLRILLGHWFSNFAACLESFKKILMPRSHL